MRDNFDFIRVVRKVRNDASKELAEVKLGEAYIEL